MRGKIFFIRRDIVRRQNFRLELGDELRRQLFLAFAIGFCERDEYFFPRARERDIKNVSLIAVVICRLHPRVDQLRPRPPSLYISSLAI